MALPSQDTSQTTVRPGGPQAAAALDLCGSGVVVSLDPDGKSLHVIPTLCHRWDCPSCAKHRTALAIARARAGQPQRMITLTLRASPTWPVSHQIDHLRKAWRRLVEHIRRTHGPFEWMAALELTHQGTPHLHVLTRGAYISQRWLSTAWLGVSGSYVVHIAKVDRVAGAIQELTKYLVKSAAQVQQHCPGRPVYTMSRSWLPPDWNDAGEKQPPDPDARFFGLSLGTTVETATRLGGSYSPVHDRPGHYRLEFPRPPNLADFHRGHFHLSDPTGDLAAYLIDRLNPAGLQPTIADDNAQQARRRLVNGQWRDPSPDPPSREFHPISARERIARINFRPALASSRP